MNPYLNQYNDPRWQKKRLETMQIDEWTCKICESKIDTLSVHHIRYISGLKIWEHPDSLLITLCKDCHDFVHYLGRWKWVKKYEFDKINQL